MDGVARLRGRDCADQIDTHRCAGAQVAGCRAATPALIVVRRDGQLLTLQRAARATAPPTSRPLSSASRSASATHYPSVARRRVGRGLRPVVGDQARRCRRSSGSSSPRSASSCTAWSAATRSPEQSFATSTVAGPPGAGADLAVAGGHQPVPVPAPRRRPHLLGVAEKVRGRRIPFAVMERAGMVGFVLIIMLFFIGLSNDISTLIGQASTCADATRRAADAPASTTARSPATLAASEATIHRDEEDTWRAARRGSRRARGRRRRR